MVAEDTGPITMCLVTLYPYHLLLRSHTMTRVPIVVQLLPLVAELLYPKCSHSIITKLCPSSDGNRTPVCLA
jgi:hypothetical protein